MPFRRYSKLKQLPTFEERFDYLKLRGKVGNESFGFDRYVNQSFYKSAEWLSVRSLVIVRDNGCDLGCADHPIIGRILIHHMNPLTIEDFMNHSDQLLNPDFLICVSHTTHNAIHYSDVRLITSGLIERAPNDTCPWKGEG